MSSWIDDRTTAGDFTCPWCGSKGDRALCLAKEARPPQPGDVGVCADCAKPMIYQEIGKPRRPTEQEWRTINQDRHVTEVRKAMFMKNEGNVRYSHMDVQVRESE